MFTIISKGGPVMYPLLLCSVTALAVIVERIIFFVRLRKTENGLSDR
ncbi:MAG TPA: MotA/TolQ/ExbB proton channel family protein, partial [Firmicutes bacterium]|nr:MotA/TolQ/ExbB proton channel family protein [Bacillota bacterium]